MEEVMPGTGVWWHATQKLNALALAESKTAGLLTSFLVDVFFL
jgi:nicotinamide mononucleotide (NMN) deamidase PncC